MKAQCILARGADEILTHKRRKLPLMLKTFTHINKSNGRRHGPRNPDPSLHIRFDQFGSRSLFCAARLGLT
jgi:hypothetical protein